MIDRIRIPDPYSHPMGFGDDAEPDETEAEKEKNEFNPEDEIE